VCGVSMDAIASKLFGAKDANAAVRTPAAVAVPAAAAVAAPAAVPVAVQRVHTAQVRRKNSANILAIDADTGNNQCGALCGVWKRFAHCSCSLSCFAGCGFLVNHFCAL